jgi:hypothetical protein
MDPIFERYLELTQCDDVQPFQLISEPSSSTSIAPDASRPKRVLKDEKRQEQRIAGRPRTVPYKLSVLTNWMVPLLWSMISRAAIVVGPKMSSTAIVKELQKKDSVLFAKLAHQTVGAAITVLTTLTNDGVLLPFQTIHKGSTSLSLPSKDSRSMSEARDAGFLFESSMTSTYWSTQASMRNFVNTILAPYFETVKVKLNLPPAQCSLWLIDCWSVHRSKEFLT